MSPKSRGVTFEAGDSFLIRLRREDVTIALSELVEKVEPPDASRFMPTADDPYTVTLTEHGERLLRDFFERPPTVPMDVAATSGAPALGPVPKKRTKG